jgi:hypothetical protein
MLFSMVEKGCSFDPSALLEPGVVPLELLESDFEPADGSTYQVSLLWKSLETDF